MNFQQWPDKTSIPAIDTNAQTDAELRQLFGTVQQLITQFNQITALQGGLEKQITSMIEKLNGLYPYDGTDARDPGYISNAVLKNWPNADFKIGATISNVLTDVLDITIGSSTVLAAAAGPLYVLDQAVYLDANHDYGMFVSSGQLWLSAIGGSVISAQKLRTAGYYSSDGTEGTSASLSGGQVFKNGLYISGDFGSYSPSGVVPEVGDNDFYVRTLIAGNGAWQPLGSFFPGIVSGGVDAWTGSIYLETLGTVTTGTWQGDPIAKGHIDNGAVTLGNMDALAANSIIGNKTSSPATPTAISVADAQTLLLNTWPGSTDIVMLGNVTTCSGLYVNGLILANRVQTNMISDWQSTTDYADLHYPTYAYRFYNHDLSKTLISCDVLYNIVTLNSLTVGTANSQAGQDGTINADANIVAGGAISAGTTIHADGTITGANFDTAGNVTAGGTAEVTGRITGANFKGSYISPPGTAIGDEGQYAFAITNARVTKSLLTADTRDGVEKIVIPNLTVTNVLIIPVV